MAVGVWERKFLATFPMPPKCSFMEPTPNRTVGIVSSVLAFTMQHSKHTSYNTAARQIRFPYLGYKQNFKTVNSPGERAKPTALYVRERSQRKQYRAVSEQDTATMLQADVFSPPLPSVHAMSRTLLRAGIARTLLRAVPFPLSSFHTLASARNYKLVLGVL